MAILADFMPKKNEIFAPLTLGDHKWWPFCALAERVEVAASASDLVAYLQACPEVLYARIQKRGIAMELQIGDAYNEFFYQCDRAPVLTVAAEHLNLLDSPGDLALLMTRIETMRGRKEFFLKGGVDT